ncbi:LCP family protein [Streptomyces sp. H27-D2]|uniref:LCP family protein n=1 Tax=Streptomyces sp. H27-D2 TaxID=3046304 RepID=UPI002DBE1CC7|nr:LCP family protein [Streptomyces sp. H27-D2]MEC4018755.1 LCP family protein [Streptomyces sp. H27-D2]
MTASARSPRSPARPTARGSAPHRTGGRKRRWGLRLAGAASVGVLATSGIGHAMVTGLDATITRVDPFHGLTDRPKESDGTNFLLVGTDGRNRITAAEKQKYRLGGQPCHCTDTIMVVHLSADRGRASVISLPRDSYAEMPAHTDRISGKRHGPHPVKLNAAYAEGGPQLTLRTVEHMTRIHIDHYLEVDFTSFMKTVDSVGGVQVCTAWPLKDAYTGLNLPVGTSRLDGGQALQYVRSRHIDAGSDLGRMHRQQRFLAALIHKVTSSGVLLNPVKFNQVAATLLGSVRADHGFGSDEMAALGQAMRGFSAASSEFTSVPVSNIDFNVPAAGSTVKWDAAKAEKLFRAVREDRPLAVHRSPHQRATVVAVAPGDIRVQVDNGTGTAGLGGKADRALRATGFTTTGSPGGAAAAPAPEAPAAPAPDASPAAALRRTVIEYDPRWDRSVKSLAAALPGAVLKPVAPRGPTMRVTLGTDYRGVRQVRGEGTGSGDEKFPAITGDEVVCG